MERKYVLENAQGQVVRTFTWNNPSMILVKRKDTHRIEAYATAEDITHLPYEVEEITKITKASLNKTDLLLANGARLRSVDQIENFSREVVVEQEEDKFVTTYLKWSSISHVSTVLGILLIGFIISKFAPDEVQPMIVTIEPRQEMRQPEKKKIEIGKLLERKPIPQKQKIAKKTSQKTKLAKNVRTSTKKSYGHANTKKSSQVAIVTRDNKNTKQKRIGRSDGIVSNKTAITNVGALGALGKLGPGAGVGGGSRIQAISSGTGNGRGLGKGAGAGSDARVFGKGLLAGSPGVQGKGRGGGAYGTPGRGGGGSSSYGSMSLVGSSSGYIAAVEDEGFVEAGIDRDAVLAVIQKHSGELRYCYEKGLQKRPNLSGRVGVQWVINPNGRVGTAKVSETSLREGSVEGCIVARLRNWQFPRPTGGVKVPVSFPFKFERQSITRAN